MEQKDNLALERDIAKRLHAIGTPADLRGYHYLIETIKIAIADKDAVFEMTKNIYEPVAKQFNVTAKQVSKAITLAILTAWDRGDLDTLQGYFGYTVSNTMGYPTNSEFIAIVAERIRLEFED